MGMLTRADIKRIEGAIGRAEAQSAGELVVAVVPRCARYGEERLIVAAVLGVGLCLLAQAWVPELPCSMLLGLQPTVILLLYALLRLPVLLRCVVRRSRLDSAVQARAYQLFAQRGVYKTHQRKGLLIFISEAEHRVVMLGDRGIDAIIGLDGWKKYVDRVVQGITEGVLADVVVKTLDELGTMIATRYPRQPDDTNELPDGVIEDA